MPQKFEAWFDENSGYALHHTAKRSFSHAACCGEAPQSTGKRILFPGKGRMEEMDLYRCSHCGRHYVRQGNHYCFIENLLKYPVLP